MVKHSLSSNKSHRFMVSGNLDQLLLLLLNMFREGIPSAVAGFQGALHLHTKIPLKSKT